MNHSNHSRGKYRTQNMSAVLLCVAGIALNLVLNMAVTSMDLPLYLDTVGSVVVAVLGDIFRE